MSHNEFLLVIEIELVACLYLDHFQIDHFRLLLVFDVEPRFKSS
jgi:hypothetical protein